MSEIRTVLVPQNRRGPLKEQWKSIAEILTKQLKLMVCVRTPKKTWRVMLRNSPETADAQHLQRGVDFVSAFVKGFSIQDALAIVRIDGIYVESFHIADVRQRLRGDHMARAVGRICGANGRIRLAIENATRTRIIVADQTIHILGSNERIAVARKAICNLIIGSPPNKVFGRIQNQTARLDSTF
ncbi:RNA-binding protein pno1 [Echinococcus granulosus]|uniref:RNA-binding protein pno1 n=1 Tax=Echinococcus granulosus TaxID=6210 RepID=U6J8M4_ECHGR|nr:RNA-binding protein pno1 [Echinococcus granulosus]EUB59823.1 RNA-binding protein pno1 [Echinococcus granulosus]KAH9284369.1 RNA-binding protein pno1 [Echinococcus granulosus]CDS20356.1 rRNA processing protein Rrp20 [Echinococcus granulosus]